MLPATPASPGVARRFVGAALRRWDVDDPTIEAAQLLVSELVTNAVVHTGSEVRLAVSCAADGSGWRSPTTTTGRPSSGPPDPTRREAGLGIVDGIAGAWGSDPRGDGKAVWFELDREPPGASPPGFPDRGGVHPGSGWHRMPRRRCHATSRRTNGQVRRR